MLITAILVAEADTHAYTLTKSALTSLLLVAEGDIVKEGLEGSEPAKWDLPQVHAQNTMRTIFTESKLAHTSFAFVEPAFSIAIKGFSADVSRSPSLAPPPPLFSTPLPHVEYDIC